MSPHLEIVQRDDGLYELGLFDAAGPFESRQHALAVANAQHRQVSERIFHEDPEGA
jgi:hypothetical protein